MNFLLLGVLVSSILLSYSIPVFVTRSYNDINRIGCMNDKCSMIISILRNPRLIPAWTTKADAWNKAIEQMQGYQELFLTDNDDMTELDKPEEQKLEQNSETKSDNRSKRTLFTPTKVQRSPKNDNMYWLIRIPGK